MNILFIGKYPPIEGGTASTAYWRHKELLKHGINFEIVTCILNDSDYCIPKYNYNENVHVLSERVSWHIPYSQLYAEQLISLALRIAKNKEFDAVEGAYLFPYGFAAFVVAKILDKPLILRHAGSDLHRIISTGQFDDVVREMTSNAKVIVTYKDCEDTWKRIDTNARLYFTERYVPNTLFFHDDEKGQNAVFLGKITEKWNRNQFDYFLSGLKEREYYSAISVYSNDYTVSAFKDYFEKQGFIVKPYSFIAPEEVPSVLKNAKYVLLSEVPSGILEESNLFPEAVKCGCEVICASEHRMPKITYDEYIQQQIKIYKETVS